MDHQQEHNDNIVNIPCCPDNIAKFSDISHVGIGQVLLPCAAETNADMDRIYHERQSKELCALHALNNIFQIPNEFSQTELDALCFSLSPEHWINPHKSVLGLGNYDVNVVTAALHSRDCDIVWFDKRKDPNIINLEVVKGFILNLPSDYKIGWLTLPLKRKHWVALKYIQGAFYNLDSKLKAPERIGSADQFMDFLRGELGAGDKQLFLVVEKHVGESAAWKKQTS